MKKLCQYSLQNSPQYYPNSPQNFPNSPQNYPNSPNIIQVFNRTETYLTKLYQKTKAIPHSYSLNSFTSSHLSTLYCSISSSNQQTSCQMLHLLTTKKGIEYQLARIDFKPKQKMERLIFNDPQAFVCVNKYLRSML